MKSGLKRHSAFAFEEMSMPMTMTMPMQMSSHWIVMNKRSRVPTIEEFCSDKDSKCTASTVDSSVSNDDSSSSSSTKRCRTCDDSHCGNNCSNNQSHSQIHIHSHSQIHSRGNARGSGSLTSDKDEEDEDNHKARTLNCTELKKTLVRTHNHQEALRSICDSRSNSDKDSKTNQHSGNIDRNTTSVRNNEGGAESVRKNNAKNGTPESWTTNGSNNSNSIIHNEADGKVKMIGLPGIRSRWAWINIDIETKTEPSPNLCSKGNSNGKGETNSSSNHTTTTDNNNTTTKKRRRSTPPWTTNGSNNSNNSIYNEADGKVKMIGLPGIRSRWAWINIDIETKTEPSPNLCSKGNINGKGETNSSNKTTTTTDNNNTATKKRRRSTPAAANKNHAENQMSDNGTMKNSLKALRDYCGKGKGSYWTEPTQLRQQVTPDRYSYKKKKVGRKRKRTGCGSKNSNNNNSEVLLDHNMNDDGSSSSNTNTVQTSSKNNIKREELHSATRTCNLEKEDAAPSSSLMTRTGIARSRNTAIRAPNNDHSIRKTDDVTKIIRKEDTEPSRDSTEIRTKAFDGGTRTRTRTSTTTTKAKAAAAPISATTHNYDDCNHQKIVFRAMEGPNQPIVRYALDLISLVCNNSYSTTNSNNGSVKNCTLQHNGSKHHRCSWSYQQVHRVLDKPPLGHTTETESEKERLMRLQFRQRFASATSTGMSPIEFAKKLLGLWGGRLEEVE